MNIEKLAFSIRETCEIAGLSRTYIYAEIAAGRIKPVKAGRRTLILKDELQRWLGSLSDA